MTAVTARRVAWGMWVLGGLAILGSTFLAAAYPVKSVLEPFDPVANFFWSAGLLGFGLTGALIVSSRPRNRIGWVLVGITFATGVALLAPVYGRVAYEQPAQWPAGEVVTWIAAWAFVPVPGLVLGLLLLFPSAALERLRHRVAARIVLGIVAVRTVVAAVTPGPVEGDAPPVNPVGLEELDTALTAIAEVLDTATGVLAVLVLVDFVWRFLRSRGVQRQQFRWMALVAAAFPLLVFVAMTLEEFVIGERGFDPMVLVVFLCGNGMAAAIGIAVTRHGLYEINRVISRTVAYLLLTGVLVALYLLAVTSLTAVTAPVAGDSPLAVAAATLIAAAAFRPARRRIQSAVDRRFNRGRYDAARTVDAYRTRLRDEVDIHALTDDLLETVNVSMQPATAALWLRNGTSTRSEEISAQTHRRNGSGTPI